MSFTFIDLFAGIGGLRLAFESQGGQCVFTSEFEQHCVDTYKANFGGEVVYKTNETQVRLNLPSRLSRNVTAAYLNCAGDLIRPDNEISFHESAEK